jgi:hypothetical protein
MSAHATSPAETRWSFQVTASKGLADTLSVTIVQTLSDDKTSGTSSISCCNSQLRLISTNVQGGQQRPLFEVV